MDESRTVERAGNAERRSGLRPCATHSVRRLRVKGQQHTVAGDWGFRSRAHWVLPAHFPFLFRSKGLRYDRGQISDKIAIIRFYRDENPEPSPRPVPAIKTLDALTHVRIRYLQTSRKQRGTCTPAVGR